MKSDSISELEFLNVVGSCAQPQNSKPSVVIKL